VKIWETNVHGVEHVLDYLSGTKIPLYHVSTAYVAGGRKGTIHEYELDGRYGFTNTYESTKWLAERQVRCAFSAGDACGAIFRPGILVGANGNGAISDFQNFYKFLRLIDLNPIQKVFGSGSIRLEGCADTLSNLVPVDWAAKALWEIVEHDGTSGRTYHLTNPRHNSLEEIRTWANKRLATVGASLSFVDELIGKLSFMEAFAVRALKHYLPYTKHQLRFDASNTLRITRDRLPFPKLDDLFYDRVFEYARHQRWKRADGAIPNNTARVAAAGNGPSPRATRRPMSVGIQVPALM
jgi:nucleoside-diphosphate-sugar epimerase